MRQTYVYSKALPSKKGPGYYHRFIGILTELKPGGKPEEYGEYQFEYKLGDTFPEWFMKIPVFHDPKGVYVNTGAVQWFVSQYLPAADFRYMDLLLESRGLKEYDEWTLLSITGDDTLKINTRLPRNIIIYGDWQPP